MDWAQILVIILSVFLAIFLIVGIVLVILLIKVTKQIKNITGSAERAVGNIEKAAANASSLTSPVFLLRTIVRQMKRFKK